MRVVHIIKVVRIAGAEQHLLTLMEGLRANHVDAQMLLLVEPSNPMDSYVEAADARAIPVQRMVIRSHMDVSLHYRLWKALKDLKLDIVHTHLLHADLFGIPAARAAGVPVVVTSRHNDNIFRRRPPIKQMNRSLWRMVDAGIAISKAIARFCVEVEGAPAGPGNWCAHSRARATGPIMRATRVKSSGGLLALRRRSMTESSDSPSSHSKAMNGTNGCLEVSSVPTCRGRTTLGISADSRNSTSPSS